jgi:thioesterase domain-containing protein
VPIQPSGSRPPFFCFHGAGGNVLIYRKLSQYLGSDQPFYGLQSQGLDGHSAIPETIEEMAALYVKEIRAVQPHGPYLLGGYCLGGSIAYEAAQQIRAAGEEVALLAFFDTLNWHKVRLSNWSKLSLYLQRLIFHASVLLKLDAEGKRKFLGEKVREVQSRASVWREMLLTKLRRGRSAGAVSNSMVLGRVWICNHHASQRYVPLPYSGEVTEFRPARQYQVLNKPDLNWESLALKGQKVVFIPTYPAMMLVEPFVKDLAIALTASIDCVICRQASGWAGEETPADAARLQSRTAIGSMIAQGVE